MFSVFLLVSCSTLPEPEQAAASIRGPLEAESVPEPVVIVDEPPAPVEEPKEVRGVWVTRWSFRTEAEMDAILDDVAEAGFTDVYLQVRGRFDALYKSDLEPWAAELTGTLGKDPGWDPLAHSVEGAHQRGMKLHAWVNTYAMWQGKAPESAGVPHPLTLHPEWRVQDAAGATRGKGHSYQFASPGNPEVREHLVAVMSDIDARYDVDGIHLDYLRYPAKDFGFDQASLDAAGEEVDFDAWRRQQIVETVAAIDREVEAELTAAVWGVFEDTWGWRASSGYSSYYQDYRAMQAAGNLGAAAPMIYWPVAEERGERLDFATLTAEHVGAAAGPILPGIDAAKMSWEQVNACIESARAEGAGGVMLFEYLALRDKGMLPKLQQGPFAVDRPALASRVD